MVSIVLVTYKRAQRLKLSIRDILNQSFRDFELIICDDCSPDETQEVCEAYAAKDDRIRYFRHESNKRMPGNLNFGVQQARYPYIAILHDGDRFRKDLIEQWYKGITSDESVGFVFNSMGDTDENDKIVKAYHQFPEGLVKSEDLLNNTYFRNVNFSSPVYGEAMVKRSLIERYGLLQPEYGFYADVDLWMEILHTHNAYYCADILYTGPVKSIQPQLFETDLIKVYLYLYNMHKKHRRRAFRSQPTKLAAEMVRFYAYALYHLTFYLLLVIKNFTFKHFINAPKRLMEHPILMMPWIGTALFYPILKPVLMLFELAKTQFSGFTSFAKSAWSSVRVSESSGVILEFVPAGALLVHDFAPILEVL